jgi:hypothetical protein
MRQVSLIIFLLIIGCSNSNSTNELVASDTVRQAWTSAEIVPSDIYENPVTLTDTVSNGYSIKFYELTSDEYDSLQKLTIDTKLPLKSADSQIKKVDSCFIVNLQSQNVDSLCNWDDGEEYEKYSIRGFWKGDKLLLVNYENWEESHDFFLNLKDGSYYILAPFYETNPTQNIVLNYVDILAAPIYSSELMVSLIQNDIITTLYKKNLEQTTITEAKWISKTDCLLATSFVDFRSNTVKERNWYRMTID